MKRKRRMELPTPMQPYVSTGTATSENVVARYTHLWIGGVNSSTPSSIHMIGNIMSRNFETTLKLETLEIFRFICTLTKPSKGTPSF